MESTTLADFIHISHSGVNAVVKVANLNEVVIKAFGDPCSITTKYADEITRAWDFGGESILRRAHELCKNPSQKRLPPKKILEYLLALVPEAPTSVPLVSDKPHLGSWVKAADGQVLVPDHTGRIFFTRTPLHKQQESSGVSVSGQQAASGA